MGTHQLDAGQYEATTTTLGPRRAAARHRKRRALLVGSAVGATLLVGGTTTAAVIATGTGPEDTPQTATVPEAVTDPLQSSSGHTDDPDHTQGSGDRTGHNATSSSQGQAVTEQDEPADQPQDSPSQTEDNNDPGSSAQPSGEGGTCEASFYGDGFHGSATANGETFDTHAMTAAHKTLPFDTKVEVTNPSNGQSVTVRINDRGPYVDGRCLDLSTAAFDEVIGTGSGVGTVDWQVVE